jgi:hypothetical protein
LLQDWWWCLWQLKHWRREVEAGTRQRLGAARLVGEGGRPTSGWIEEVWKRKEVAEEK